MIGEAESAEAVQAWEFQVKVTEHGERHIKMETGSTWRDAMPKLWSGSKFHASETDEAPIYHGRDQALKGSELRRKLSEKKLKDERGLAGVKPDRLTCSLPGLGGPDLEEDEEISSKDDCSLS
mmetsp:Transcript_126505/g.289322  ORF Transcript_126505/g.289322 Transcript_126505/m.289322 type:complete len:123 (+) Transcript_126505:246-614(+)